MLGVAENHINAVHLPWRRLLPNNVKASNPPTAVASRPSVGWVRLLRERPSIFCLCLAEGSRLPEPASPCRHSANLLLPHETDGEGLETRPKIMSPFMLWCWAPKSVEKLLRVNACVGVLADLGNGCQLFATQIEHLDCLDFVIVGIAQIRRLAFRCRRRCLHQQHAVQALDDRRRAGAQ